MKYVLIFILVTVFTFLVYTQTKTEHYPLDGSANLTIFDDNFALENFSISRKYGNLTIDANIKYDDQKIHNNLVDLRCIENTFKLEYGGMPYGGYGNVTYEGPYIRLKSDSRKKLKIHWPVTSHLDSLSEIAKHIKGFEVWNDNECSKKLGPLRL